MVKITLDTNNDEQMNQVAKKMWYTNEEFKVSFEVLQYLSKCWLDLIPQYITDMILDKITKNRLDIPWLTLNGKNIDLRHGNFGEAWEKKTGLSIEAKMNLVKFVNKAIYGYVEVPLNIEDIANGKKGVNKDKFMTFCFEQWLILDKEKNIWDHHKIIQNLKYKPAIYNHES